MKGQYCGKSIAFHHMRCCFRLGSKSIKYLNCLLCSVQPLKYSRYCTVGVVSTVYWLAERKSIGILPELTVYNTEIKNCTQLFWPCHLQSCKKQGKMKTEKNTFGHFRKWELHMLPIRYIFYESNSRNSVTFTECAVHAKQSFHFF